MTERQTMRSISSDAIHHQIIVSALPTTMEGPPKPLRLFFFSQVRTMSNLFMRILEQHPELKQDHYLFLRAYQWGPERLQIGGNPESREQCKEEYYQVPFDKLLNFIEETESEGKIPLVKEHIYMILNPHIDHISAARRALSLPNLESKKYPFSTRNNNPTVFPDALMETFAPIIIIRHPARVIPSYVKLASGALSNTGEFNSDFITSVQTKWTRFVFEYYRALYSSDNCPWPVVIDADDLVNDTANIMVKFCKLAGLDETSLKYEWETGEGKDPMDTLYRGTLLKSTGVIRDDKYLKPPILDEEVKKWEGTYGKDLAESMKTLVEEAMEDYNWLRQFRLT